MYPAVPFRLVWLFSLYVFQRKKGDSMEKLSSPNQEHRIAMIGIVVENPESVDTLNDILHDYRQYIIGRMGIPYREKELSIISIALDAPQNIISALSGKVGKLNGVSSKTIYSRVKAQAELPVK